METIGEDPENICRTCLQKGTFIPLAGIHEIFSSHFDILSLCQLDLDDGLPQQICSECFENLRQIMLFLSKCNKAYKVLNGFESLEPPMEPEPPKPKEPVKLEAVITIHDEKPELIEPKLETKPYVKKIYKARAFSTCNHCGNNYSTKAAHYSMSPQCRPKNFKCQFCSWKTHCGSKLKVHLRRHARHRDKVKKTTPNPVPQSQLQVVTQITSILKTSLAGGSDVTTKKKSPKQNVHKCPVNGCSCWYRTNDNMLKHLKTVHNRFKCRYCDKTYVKKWSVDEHVRSAHSRGASGNSEKSSANERVCVKEEKGEDEKASFKCSLCQKSFGSSTTMARHKELFHHRKQPTSAPVGGPIRCPKCPRVFQLKQQLQIHLKVHARETVVYKCGVCYQAFFNKKILDAHVMASHDDMDGMPVLQPMVKPAVQSISCPISDASMKGKNNLYDHMKVHSDEKRYECHVCGTVFKWPKTRRSHIIKMHGAAELNNIKHLKRR